ncbi:MAG TPA: DUF4239 domain-containing protein [Anaeromyxobacteraceae bacterium]|nr:DUF4239 domain-containing protein [Anaeromyxobacteraceae bacterium]
MPWIYRLPLAVFFVVDMATFVGATLLGLWLLRPVRDRLAGRVAESFAQVSYFGTQVWLVYSLILSLVAVGSWTNFQAANDVVSRESAALEVLARKADLYPEPERTTLGGLIRDYARAVADEEWPVQRAGGEPAAGQPRLHVFRRALNGYEPRSRADELMHAETLAELTRASELRRDRVHAARTGLPGLVWLVVLAGSAVALAGATFFVHMEDRRLHKLLAALMAAFVGLVVFVTAALDHPFQGSVSPSEEPFRRIATRPFDGR